MKSSLFIALVVLVLGIISCTTVGTAVPEIASVTAPPVVVTTPLIVPSPSTPTVTTAKPNAQTSSPTLQLLATVTTSPPPTAGPYNATQIAMAHATLHALRWPTTVETPDPYNLIDNALAKGEIDIDHASVFRFYALFGSPYLPPRFTVTGPLIRGDALGAYVYAMKDVDLTSPATQRFLAGYVTPREITQTVPTPTFPAPLPAPGIYVTVLAAQDNLAGAPSLAGRWKLDMTARERSSLYLNDRLVVTRMYRQTAEQITFSDLFGSYACDDNGQNAIYNWTVQNQSLTFRRIRDDCSERVRLMEAHSWMKQ